MPHAHSRAESLWWYMCEASKDWAEGQPTVDAERVIQSYIKQCARGRTLPPNFEADLHSLLRQLSLPQQISPRRRRYWTIPAYAFAHKLHSKTLCKRLRELEKIAKKLFPGRVPKHRECATVTDEKKRAIRSRFRETGDFQIVASEFGIEPFRVGQICRKEKAEMSAEKEKLQRAWEGAEVSPSFNSPEDEEIF